MKILETEQITHQFSHCNVKSTANKPSTIVRNALLHNPDVSIRERSSTIYKLGHSSVEIKNAEKTFTLWLTPADKSNDGLFILDTTDYSNGHYIQTRFLTDQVKLEMDKLTRVESLFPSDSGRDCVRLKGIYVLDAKKLPQNGTTYLYALIIHPPKVKASFLNFGSPIASFNPPEIIRVRLKEVCFSPNNGSAEGGDTRSGDSSSGGRVSEQSAAKFTVQFKEHEETDYSDGDGDKANVDHPGVGRIIYKKIFSGMRFLALGTLFSIVHTMLWNCFMSYYVHDDEGVNSTASATVTPTHM